MHDLTSIIIPVYNAEKYIRKCLDSIIAQSHTNWEAILVDDGSPDNSGVICDEYATKDNRFKVIHQQNGGVSVARQTGLDNATGDYIIHCDPDDWIEPSMLEEMLECLISNNAGMVICNIVEHFNNKSIVIKQHLNAIHTSKEIQELLINQKMHGSCCNKLIKKDFCKKTPFHPANIKICEDELFNIRVLNNNFNVAYLPKGLYNYNRTNNTSACNSRNIKNIESRMQIIEECEKFIGKEQYNNFYEMKRNVLHHLLMYKYYKLICSTYTEIHPEIIKYGKKYMFHFPLGYFLAMAVKGHPRLASLLYKSNIYIINSLKKIKHSLVKTS